MVWKHQFEYFKISMIVNKFVKSTYKFQSYLGILMFWTIDYIK